MLARSREFYLFDIFGFRVTADWSWIAVFVFMSLSLATGYYPALFMGESAFVYWALGIASAALLFFSVVLHEVGHSYVASQHGIRILGIRLFIFGGVAQLDREPQSADSELKIALAGPAVSAVLALAFYAVSQLPVNLVGGPLALLAGFLARVNVAMVLFNLLPGFPLDGGRVLRAWLWKRKRSYYQATRIAGNSGRLVAYGFMGLGALMLLGGGFVNGLWLIFIGMFLNNAAKSVLMQTMFGPYGLNSAPVDSTIEDAIRRDFSPRFRHFWGWTRPWQHSSEQRQPTATGLCEFYDPETGQIRRIRIYF